MVIQIALQPTIEVRAARPYVSPRTRPLTAAEMETRALSYLLKLPQCPDDGILLAAAEMAALIEGPCSLVPVPNHEGDTLSNFRLCVAIGQNLAGPVRVWDVLTRRTPIESSCERHRAGLPPLTVEDHGILRTSGRLMAAPVWMVDNVTTSGRTLEACAAALGGFARGLVFADAWQSECLAYNRHTRRALA